MKNLVLSLAILISLLGYGQGSEKEINEHVWKPFTKAIMNHDVTMFISVHSKDLVRAERDGKRVLNYE